LNSARQPLKLFIEQTAHLMQQELSNILPSVWDVPDMLKESMMYSLLAGGKRMRPMFVLAAAESLHGSLEEATPVACAIELIHTYSLIHDDLPAMDNDDLRRGKPTNHKVFGDAMAILAGDALLTHAFFILSTIPERYPRISTACVVDIIKELSMYSGARGMVGGQAADILGEQGATTLEQLQYIHLHKTADLIICSLRAGGMIAGATNLQLEALEIFGRSIGLAFQIQDDILDVTGEQSKLGKTPKSDESQSKVTYPYLLGLDESRRLVEELTRTGKEALNSGNIPLPQRLLELADFLMGRDY
jgi:geranylgeranyl diphosphate synthase type II